MSKIYTLFVDGQKNGIHYGTKKTAVKYGEASGKSYQVQSPSGAVVHAVQVDAPKKEKPKPEPQPEPKVEETTKEDVLKVEVLRNWPGNYAIEMVPFVQRLADAFGGLEVRVETSPTRLDRQTYISGSVEDVEEFLPLLDLLVTESRSALREWQKKHIETRRTQTDQERYVAHRKFLADFSIKAAKDLKKVRAAK